MLFDVAEDDLFTGMGYWTRANAEICILATKGHPKRVDAGVRQVILSHIEEPVSYTHLDVYKRQFPSCPPTWNPQAEAIRTTLPPSDGGQDRKSVV